MKKLLIALLLILAVSTICIYVFIPRQISITHKETININDRWAFNYLMTTGNWTKWWPKDGQRQDSAFEHNGQQFLLDTLFYNAMNIKVVNNGDTNQTKLLVLPVKGDEVHLVWQSDYNGTLNPFTRFKAYKNAVATKQSFIELLATYKSWLNVTENVYGFNIVPAKILDTMLLAKRAQFKDNYPTPVQVDSLFNLLRKYANKYNAQENGRPMLHIVSNEPGVYEAQVALPINKAVPETGELRMKRMFAGNALVTRFKGGPYTIQKAYEACENYKLDHLRTSPAIPFQSLVTDRVSQPDTTKWETILYYPVH